MRCIICYAKEDRNGDVRHERYCPEFERMPKSRERKPRECGQTPKRKRRSS